MNINNSNPEKDPLPHLILVNDQDEAIGTAEKLAAHEQGLLHRAFSVFVFNHSQELLLQQRSTTKYHCGGLWTNTCCSHPIIKEPTIVTAKKRLQYEMGVSADLSYAGVFTYKAEFANGLIEHEIDHVYIANVANIIPEINPEEAEQYKWISISDLKDQLSKTPQLFTPWLPQSLEIASTKLLTQRNS
jgi:isopentenyl-diphosphate Delta-isomerase